MVYSTDSWGIPDNLFGPVPEEFYAVVGRVAMLAALLDDMMLRLTWALTDEVQSVHAGKVAPELDKVCRRAVARNSDDLRTDVTAALDRARATRGLRNAVVHSLWPNPTLDSAFGWRPARSGVNGQMTVTFPATRAALEELIASLVDEIDEFNKLQQRAHTEKAAR